MIGVTFTLSTSSTVNIKNISGTGQVTASGSLLSYEAKSSDVNVSGPSGFAHRLDWDGDRFPAVMINNSQEFIQSLLDPSHKGQSFWISRPITVSSASMDVINDSNFPQKNFFGEKVTFAGSSSIGHSLTGVSSVLNFFNEVEISTGNTLTLALPTQGTLEVNFSKITGAGTLVNSNTSPILFERADDLSITDNTGTLSQEMWANTSTRTDEKSVDITNPQASQTVVLMKTASHDLKVKKLDFDTDGGQYDFNVSFASTLATALSGGTDLLASDQSITPGGGAVSSFAVDVIPKNSWVIIKGTLVTGTPSHVAVQMTYINTGRG